jgi:hypothetical protein
MMNGLSPMPLIWKTKTVSPAALSWQQNKKSRPVYQPEAADTYDHLTDNSPYRLNLSLV